jgi:hypothetical protein
MSKPQRYKPHQENSAIENNPSNEDERECGRVTVEIPRAPANPPTADDEHRTKEERYWKLQVRWQKATTIVTGLAVLVAAIYAGFARQQVTAMRNAVTEQTGATQAAKDAADAAKAANVIAQESTERDLRAYVAGVPTFIFSFDAEHLTKIKFAIINSGKTPAYEETHQAEIIICPNPLPPGYVFPPIGGSSSPPIALFPNVPFYGTKISDKCFTADEIDGVRKGSMAIYVFGEIHYRDAFQKERWTKFSSIVLADKPTMKKLTSNYGPSDLKVDFGAAPAGNDAD